MSQFALMFERHASYLTPSVAMAAAAVSSPESSTPSAAAAAAASAAAAWCVEWPSDLVSHPARYRPPPEKPSPVSAPLPAFRNPAFWADQVRRLLQTPHMMCDLRVHGGIC